MIVFYFCVKLFICHQEKMRLCIKKKKKSETQTQLGENEKQEKKAMQQEREPNKEPIKKGEGKHCADQAVSLLKQKTRNTTRRRGIEQRQGHRENQKTARLQTN